MMGDLVVRLGLNSKGFTRGIDQSKKSLGGLSGFASKAIGGALAIGAGIAVAGAVAVKSAFSFAAYGDQLDKMAGRTGFTTNALSELGFAAEQSGTDINTLELGIKGMQKQLLNAERGLSTSVDSLKDLGLTYKDLEGLSPEDQFMKLAGAVGDVQDPSKKAALAMSVFGKAGNQLVPLLSGGIASIEELRQQARDLGISMSPEDAKAAAEFTDIWNSLKKVLKGVGMTLGKAVLPVLTSMIGIGVSIGKSFLGLIKTLDPVWSAIGSFFRLIWRSVTATVDAFMNMFRQLTGFSGSTFTTIINGVNTFFKVFQFAFDNMFEIGKLVFFSLALGAVDAFGQIKYIFADAIPALLQWFLDNWKNIFNTLWEFHKTVFLNLAENMKSTMKDVWDYVASGGKESMSTAWKPLLDGFESTVDQLVLPERIKSELQLSLENTVQNLSTGLSEKFQDMFGIQGKKTPRGDAKGKDKAKPEDNKAGAGLAGAVLKGSTAAYSAIVKSSNNQKDALQKQQLNVLKEQKKEQEKSNKELQKVNKILKDNAGSGIVGASIS